MEPTDDILHSVCLMIAIEVQRGLSVLQSLGNFYLFPIVEGCLTLTVSELVLLRI